MTTDERLARIEERLDGLRDVLKGSDLPNRVRVLEDDAAERRGAVKALRLAQIVVAIIVSLLTGVMLVRGGA